MIGKQDDAGWQATFDLPDGAVVPLFETALDDIVVAADATVSAFEFGSGPAWRLTIHFAGKPDEASLAACLDRTAASAGIAAPVLRIEPLTVTDWLDEYRRRARPAAIGRFFIYPSHHGEGVPAGMTGIALDAGLAFGTGEHESTHGCLLALDGLRHDGLAVRRALDLGCGSGILAIAIAKLWPDARVLAGDNDPVAVAVAAENTMENGVAARIETVVVDGYAASAIRQAAPFDLISANILAEPLIVMAADLACHLAPAGRAVLSGILTVQAAAVEAAHEAHGCSAVTRIERGAWTTLVLERRGR